jgi:hypothetical protein
MLYRFSQNDMKNKLKIIFSFLLFSAACSKFNNSTDAGSVIYNLRSDSTSIIADGTSLLHFSVNLDSMATTDHLGVQFKINIGNFPGGPANAVDTVELVQAQFIGKSLIATAVVQVPQTPGTLIISAQPNLPQIQNKVDYILKDTVQIVPSVPDTIILVGSNAGIASNYGSQVTFTGYLYNSALGKVSLGNKVLFADSLLTSVSANGYWTNVIDTSNASSQVSGIYSIGPGTTGTPIQITCTLLDPVTGAKTSISGKTIIYINK